MICASIFAFVVWSTLPELIGSGCTVTPLDEAVSPDLRWRAVVESEVCESPFLSYEISGVRLVGIADPSRSVDILGVDDGYPHQRPRLLWISPALLQITVPNISFLKLLRRTIDGVQVVVRYDPDDLPARKAWRRTLGREGTGLDDP